jgi:hypothetical protein
MAITRKPARDKRARPVPADARTPRRNYAGEQAFAQLPLKPSQAGFPMPAVGLALPPLLGEQIEEAQLSSASMARSALSSSRPNSAQISRLNVASTISPPLLTSATMRSALC